ncbi:MAG: metallophosphoesterase [Vicinamibacterales bacterium]
MNYCTCRTGHVRFLALDSNYMDEDQQAWLEKELAASDPKWTIASFHHPLYSSVARHGLDLRAPGPKLGRPPSCAFPRAGRVLRVPVGHPVRES